MMNFYPFTPTFYSSVKVLPSRRIGRVVVTFAGISGKDQCSIGLGPKFVAAFPKHLENGNFAEVNVSFIDNLHSS